jgi:hypothetical protein
MFNIRKNYNTYLQFTLNWNRSSNEGLNIREILDKNELNLNSLDHVVINIYKNTYLFSEDNRIEDKRIVGNIMEDDVISNEGTGVFIKSPIVWVSCWGINSISVGDLHSIFRRVQLPLIYLYCRYYRVIPYRYINPLLWRDILINTYLLNMITSSSILIKA